MDCVLPKFTRKEELGAYIVTLIGAFLFAVPVVWSAGLLDGRFSIVNWRSVPMGACGLAWVTIFLVSAKSPARLHKCDAKRPLTKMFVTIISLEMIGVFALVSLWLIGSPFAK